MAADGQPGAHPESGAGSESGAHPESGARREAAAGDPASQPGLARERTALAWTRTALSFAAVGGVVLKREVIPGLILLAVAPGIWQLGRLAYRRQERLILLTAAVVGVAVVALVVSFTA
jgi:uncharacterized membrane protein YidH (DUF202 family)